MSDVQKHKSRRNLLLVIAVFVLPIVLAKLALTQNWLEYGVTNKGTLVENELTLQELGIVDDELNNMWLCLRCYAIWNKSVLCIRVRTGLSRDVYACNYVRVAQ